MDVRDVPRCPFDDIFDANKSVGNSTFIHIVQAKMYWIIFKVTNDDHNNEDYL